MGRLDGGAVNSDEQLRLTESKGGGMEWVGEIPYLKARLEIPSYAATGVVAAWNDGGSSTWQRRR